MKNKMGSLTTTQITVTAGAFFLSVLLFLAPVIPSESKNTDGTKAKIDQAVSLVKKGEQPMKGILMLREIAEENPENAEAAYHLGVFSVQSGQYEKAIERFNKVLELEPENFQAHFYLGHAFAGAGENDKAIRHFEKYISTANDKESIAAVNKYIKELKNI